jgi:hypothetical protein
MIYKKLSTYLSGFTEQIIPVLIQNDRILIIKLIDNNFLVEK